MSSPLTDKINALTAYANEVTSEFDTTLSDAVHTLADGYGQGGGGISQGIEIVTDANGKITDYIFHGFTEIPPFALNYVGYNRTGAIDGYPTISFADKPTAIGKSAFRGVAATLDWSGLTEVEKVGGDYALSPVYSADIDGSSSVVNLPKYKGYVDNTYSGLSLFRPYNNNVTVYGPKVFNLPVCTVIPQYAWYQNAGTGFSITIGSVGHAVTGSNSKPFGATSNASGTVTIYTDGSHLDAVKTAVQQNAGANLTFVYKASEATTYGGVSYSAGDTITV